MKFTKNGATLKNYELLELTVALREASIKLNNDNFKILTKKFNKMADEINEHLEKIEYFKKTSPF